MVLSVSRARAVVIGSLLALLIGCSGSPSSGASSVVIPTVTVAPSASGPLVITYAATGTASANISWSTPTGNQHADHVQLASGWTMTYTFPHFATAVLNLVTTAAGTAECKITDGTTVLAEQTRSFPPGPSCHVQLQDVR